ncbi:chitinase-3-like protein 1 [Limulus polyphemus]|uniref:Chitinase-3-like protein 1 n=1 Tax=Limulus polyphemus TaxID=6850 RepID=A0ABM1SM09_LIMPO|nr:chitinase-3-like protein 1 [Limulus polyphemus]
MHGTTHITVILVLILASFSTVIHCTNSSFTNSTGSIFCVFGSSAVYRPGDGKFTVEHINPLLCTHLIFLHATLPVLECKILRESEDLPGPIIGGQNLNNLCYADDTVLTVDSEEKLQEIFVDYVLVLTLDYHGPWERKTGHYAPLYCHTEHTLLDRRLCVDYSINYWIKKGVPSHKLVMAIGTYGRSYKLVDPIEHEIGAEAEGPYIGGHYTSSPGFLGMNEMCEILLTIPGAEIGEENGHVVPYVHLYDHWVSFDDELSVYYKVQYSVQQDLAGVVLWTMDTDDWRNKCSYGSFPLHVAAKGAMTGELILDGL